MRKVQEALNYLHRINNKEGSLFGAQEISTLKPGDVFVRQGAPCLRLDPPASIVALASTAYPNHVMVVNLVSGSAWFVPSDEMIHPAFGVELTYNTARSG